jgi:hypothetical protein
MEKLNALTLALRQNAQGEADLGGLNEDYARAENMRNTSNAKVNQYGTVSPFAVMADVINQSRGRKDMREIAPQRTAARSSVANNANALPLYRAQQMEQQNAYDKTIDAQNQQNVVNARADTNANRALKQTMDAAELKAEQDKYASEQSQRATGPTAYTDKESGNTVYVSRDKAGNFINSEGTILNSLQGLIEKPTETTDITQFGYGDKAEDKIANDSLMLMGQANRVGTKANALPDSAKAELNSGAVRFGQWFLDAATPQGLNALIKSEYSGYSPEAKSFLESLARMSAEERHALFGAALTEGEERSGAEFLAFVNGLSLDQIMSRAKDTFGSNREKLITQDNNRGGTRRQESIERNNWTAFDEQDTTQSVPPPSGVDASEWGQYSPAQQAAYVKKFGAD